MFESCIMSSIVLRATKAPHGCMPMHTLHGQILVNIKGSCMMQLLQQEPLAGDLDLRGHFVLLMQTALFMPSKLR